MFGSEACVFLFALFVIKMVGTYQILCCVPSAVGRWAAIT